jgi:hypothetical protein
VPSQVGLARGEQMLFVTTTPIESRQRVG